MMEAHEAREALRESQQGKGKPIISTEFKGYRITAVGNRIHWAKTDKTFTDFLSRYIRNVLDPDWGNAELKKPLEERHTILQWYDKICRHQQEHMKKPAGEIQEMPLTGAVAAYYGLAYNLYLLQHNVELQGYLVKRLKLQDSFHGAYYETYVAAWFILAGFELRLENEEDPTRTHPEFVAMRDGQSFSVEAKTRQERKDHLQIGNQLYDALSIDDSHTRVVFIDMNVGVDIDPEAFERDVLTTIESREKKMTIKGEPAPPAHVFVTNQPYHLALEETKLPRACLIAGFKIPDFGHAARFTSYTAAYKARQKYKPLLDVQKAMVDYSIPVTFDGELPEFAFGEAERRFTIGERLEVAEGVFVTLQSGVVVVSERMAFLVVTDDNGQHHIWKSELTDAELEAYRAHPETFFGRIVKVSRNTEDPMELYDFFYQSYKDTPKDKLLEFMKDAPNLEELKKLPVHELVYRYAEGMTWAVINKRKKT